MIPRFSTNITCSQCKVNVEEALELKEKLRDEVEAVREFTHLGDRVSEGGGCEAAVTARTRCGWVKFRQRSELLYGIYKNDKAIKCDKCQFWCHIQCIGFCENYHNNLINESV